MGIFRRAAKLLQDQVQEHVTKEPSLKEQLSAQYQEILSQVSDIKLWIGDVASQVQRLENQIESLLVQEQDLENEAEHALLAGDEDTAKEALTKRRRVAEKRLSLQERVQVLKNKLKQLQDAQESLREQAQEFTQRRDELEADLSAASAKIWLQKTSDKLKDAKTHGLTDLEEVVRTAQVHEELLTSIDEEFERLLRKTTNGE